MLRVLVDYRPRCAYTPGDARPAPTFPVLSAIRIDQRCDRALVRAALAVGKDSTRQLSNSEMELPRIELGSANTANRLDTSVPDTVGAVLLVVHLRTASPHLD